MADTNALNVDIHWTHYNHDRHNATGSVGGAFAAFEIDRVLQFGYRLKVNLPKQMFDTSKAESFHITMDEAKEAAKPYASAFYVNFADSVLSHPAIRHIDKVTRFDFPAQLCHGDCKFYGGDGQHDDIVMEKHADNAWTISLPRNGWLYVNPSQDWDEPTATLDDPASARFLWPLEEGLEQVHFMQCG